MGFASTARPHKSGVCDFHEALGASFSRLCFSFRCLNPSLHSFGWGSKTGLLSLFVRSILSTVWELQNIAEPYTLQVHAPIILLYISPREPP